MDKIPRMPSRRENYAKVRCKAEDHKLSSIKDELDKVWHTESRFLGAHRNRFILDRRRSLGNVYNSQIEGIQPHRRIHRRRRDSEPEVIDIFRRQEDRRRSVKAIENAVAKDVMSRLERKYQEALARNESDVEEDQETLGQNGSDEDEEESESDADVICVPSLENFIEGPDFEQSQKEPEKTEVKQKGKLKSTDSTSQQPKVSRIPVKNTAVKNTAKSQNASKKSPDQNKQKSPENPEERHKKDTRKTRTDSTAHDAPPQNSDTTKQASFSTENTLQIPKRKRSYSDGNISMSIFELQNTAMHPFILAKAAAAAAAAAAATADEDNTEYGMQKPIEEFSADARLSSSQSSLDMPGNEMVDTDTDVSESSPQRRRRVGEVSFDVRPDLTASPRRHADVTSRPLPHDIMQSPKIYRRRGGGGGGGGHSPRSEEIRLSPSLKRRLGSVDFGSPRRDSEAGASDVSSSPTMTRRRADVSHISPRMTRHATPAAASNNAAAADRDSPTRRKKEDKPKPIYQHTNKAEKPVPKPRPLRRSRSEMVDLSTLITFQEAGFSDVPRTERRGSDSLQGLGTADFPRKPPQVWNSLLFGLALNQEEREEIARHKRKELVTSLRKRQEEVDSDVSRRIRTFLQRYDDT